MLEFDHGIIAIMFDDIVIKVILYDYWIIFEEPSISKVFKSYILFLRPM